jgi:hypothetical protein
VPFAHRLCRNSAKDLRNSVTGKVDKWKNRYYNMKGLSQKVDQYLQQGPDLERLKGIVEFGILGQFGMGSSEVTQNIHTPKGFQRMLSTPLWKGGNLFSEWKDDALL